MAKDQDLKYCDEQIDKQQKIIDALGVELYNLMKQHDDYAALENYYKEERKAVAKEVQSKSDRIHKEQCELGQMKRHRKDLKKLKTMVKFQNKCAERTHKGGD